MNPIPQVSSFEIGIPFWQMAIYVVIVSFCTLTNRRKLFLITTYLFTFYWGFFLYWGEFIATLDRIPTAAAWYLILGMIHIILTLIAFFQEG